MRIFPLILSFFVVTSLVATQNQEETNLETKDVVLHHKEKLADSLHTFEDDEAKETIKRIIDSNFNLRSYKPNYFLPLSYRYDTVYVPNGLHEGQEKEVETEFQVSIRYDFAPNFFGFGEYYSFGYTQRSWWQVYSESAFFRETNYQPEFFVTLPTYTFMPNSMLKGFKLAFIHQSNGRGGEYERSWNRISLSSFFQVGRLLSEVEFWYRTHDKNDYNPNLLDYLGYGQVRFILPYKKHLLKLLLRSNISNRKSAVEFTYSYPIPGIQSDDLFLYFKTFNGYGESLIDYNHNVNKVSLGVSISR
jgi:phospholipase A1